MRSSIFLWSALLLFNACNSADAPLSSETLYMAAEASGWNEATPLGNGRLGAMVYGGVEKEFIRLNDDTFWSGKPRKLQNPNAAAWLPDIRNYLKKGDHKTAEQLIDTHLLGPNNECYMPLADLQIVFGDSAGVRDYRRELNLKEGVLRISYEQNGVHYLREAFVSYPDQCLVYRIHADKPEAIRCETALSSQVRYELNTGKEEIRIQGRAPIHADPHYEGERKPVYEEQEGMRFTALLRVHSADGDCVVTDSSLQITKASDVTLLFTAATSYNGFDKDPYKEGIDDLQLCSDRMGKASQKSYGALYNAHVTDFSELFGRVKIDLGGSERDQWPLEKRIASYDTDCDPGLTALYYQFGRYLTISASRAGTQPSNLQGIWNRDMQPAWSSNYTLNCNAQINYWGTNAANLAECHLPLFTMIREASVDGARTARTLYNASGWMFHHNLDLWRTTWPVSGSGSWALFQVGGAWLCHHIWEHYQFTGDLAFLREHYSLLHDAVDFYMDHLQEDEDGYLVTSPSVSFENHFKDADGNGGWACMGSSQDMQIIRSLFLNTLAAGEVLNEDPNWASQVKSYLDRLAPMRINERTGELQEWNDDREPQHPFNGQTGHGWGLAPGNLISLYKTPELAHAFRKTIENRKPDQSYNSGSWTGAFPAMYWARLGEGEKMQAVLDRHFKEALFPNLTSMFFQKYWQIDGNLGMMTAIGELLLQSQDGVLHLLPALPAKYPAGTLSGACARGGYQVALSWSEGTLKDAEIRSSKSDTVTLRYGNQLKAFQVKQKIPLKIKVINGELTEL